MQLDCEWNRGKKRPLTAQEIFANKAHAKAEWFMGENDELAVCNKCVNNPRLIKKYKIRRRIDNEENQWEEVA